MKKITGIIFALLFLGLAALLYMRMDSSSMRDNGEVEITVTETQETVIEQPKATGETAEPTNMISVPSCQPEETPNLTVRPRRSIVLSEDSLPEELLLPAKQKGTVLEEDYKTRDLVSDLPYVIHKNVMVYLPYGYEPENKYDVLILLHCAWADQRFWLGEDRNYGTETEPVPLSTVNLLDRMIEENYCEPLIVLSPCIYLYDGQPSNAGNAYDYAQYTKEFGADFLPWVVENYATYAADGSREGLRNAREHFGILGASFGAYASYISLIGDNFDLAAWYTFCGGGEIDPGYLTDSWARSGTGELPLRMIYICEGEYDDRAGPEQSYYNLLNAGGPFEETNIRFTLVRGWGHEDHSYLVGLYNTLQLFFRNDGFQIE